MIAKNAPEPVDNLSRVRSQKTIKLECAAIVLANGSGPFWVIRVDLTVRRSLPVFP
jgi:hypothetical protein